MRTLRTRLILSHLLPLLLILPLLGLALIYVLETRVLLPALTAEMVRQAELVAALAGGDDALSKTLGADPRLVEQARIGPFDSILLVDAPGAALATDAPRDPEPGPRIPDEVLAGESYYRVEFSETRRTQVATVWVPVRDPTGEVVGALRLTQELHSLREDLLGLRYWIMGLLLIALSIGATIGTLLALNLGRPIDQVTRAVYDLASGQWPGPLPEQGPEEIRLLLAAVNSLNDRLRSLEGARRRLLANLVHELGRPLGAMLAAVQALRGGATDEAEFRGDLLAGIEGETKRLGGLVESLAQLYDRVLGTFELATTPVDLNRWLPVALTPWRAAAEAKGLHWQTTVPPDLPTIPADPDRIGQVLGNLLANAIKYTPVGGRVHVSAGSDAEYLWIRVEDTGSGILPEEQSRVFEAFYRSHTQTRFPQGMGLGLTIARDIAEAHGGCLTLASRSGRGSAFTLYLPLAVGAHAAVRDAS